MGTISATGDTSSEGLRRAAVVGSVMGSFTVEDFSTERLESLTMSDIKRRFSEFQSLTTFEGFDDWSVLARPGEIETRVGSIG